MGTRPYIRKKSVTLFRMFSRNINNNIAAPSVIDKNASDGGYLFTLKKDNTVNTVPLGCCDMGNGSP